MLLVTHILALSGASSWQGAACATLPWGPWGGVPREVSPGRCPQPFGAQPGCVWAQPVGSRAGWGCAQGGSSSTPMSPLPTAVSPWCSPHLPSPVGPQCGSSCLTNPLGLGFQPWHRGRVAQGTLIPAQSSAEHPQNGSSLTDAKLPKFPGTTNYSPALAPP